MDCIRCHSLLFLPLTLLRRLSVARLSEHLASSLSPSLQLALVSVSFAKWADWCEYDYLLVVCLYAVEWLSFCRSCLSLLILPLILHRSSSVARSSEQLALSSFSPLLDLTLWVLWSRWTVCGSSLSFLRSFHLTIASQFGQVCFVV